MPTFESHDGVRIHYEDHPAAPVGTASEGTAPGGGDRTPLVLCYGLGGNTGLWEPQVEAFTARGRLVIWDPRGLGRSASPRPEPGGPARYSLEIGARDLLALLDHLEIAAAHVGGLSLGGGIAIRVAVAHPQRTRSLLLFDSATALGKPVSPAMRRLRYRTRELALAEGMDAVARYSMEQNPNITGRAAQGEEAAGELLAMYRLLDPVGFGENARMLADQPDATHLLGEVTVPTLVLAGEHDPALPAARETAEAIAGARLVVLEGAGHLSNRDRPEEFNRAVLGFLERIR